MQLVRCSHGRAYAPSDPQPRGRSNHSVLRRVYQQWRVAVYDLGGGSLDISILEIQDGIYQTLSVGGDTHPGGEDFDQRITAWLVEKFQEENAIDLAGDRAALLRLRQAAEKAKCELSSVKQTEIVLPFLAGSQSAPKRQKL